MFLKKIKYEMFDKYTLGDKIILEYKKKVEEKYKENRNSMFTWGNFCDFITSLVISQFTIFFVIRILYMTSKIEIFEKTIIENIILIFVMLLYILDLLVIIPKTSFILFKESRKDKINYKRYFYEGLKKFWLLRSYFKEILIFLGVEIVIVCIVLLCDTKLITIIFGIYVVLYIVFLMIIEKLKKENKKLKRKYILWLQIMTIIFICIIVYFIIKNDKNINDFLDSFRKKSICENLDSIKKKIISNWNEKIAGFFLIFNFILGSIVLYQKNKNYKREEKNRRNFIFSLLTILILLIGIVSFISIFFNKNQFNFLFLLNTVISGIFVFLIINKFINNMQSLKRVRERIRKEKKEILLKIIRLNGIDKEKYFEVISSSKYLKYYNFPSKFNLVVKGLISFGGIQIIVEKLKELKKEDIDWFFEKSNSFKHILEDYKNVLVVITYTIIFVFFLWIIWKGIIFLFKQVIEMKYLSEEDFLEFYYLMEDIMIEETSNEETDSEK